MAGRKQLTENDELERKRIGATIRALRTGAKEKVDPFATSIGISAPYLSNIEAGRKPITPALLQAIALRLNVNPDSIVRSDYFDTDDLIGQAS